jgi:membrane protein DedA with SNARE-associated domain
MHFVSAGQITDAIAAWGYLGIFICVFIGNLGVPVPEETVLLIAGFLAGQDVLDVRTVYAAAVVSAIFGDSCGYVLGRTGGQRLMERLASKFEFARRRYEWLKTFFTAHGSKAVFFARFITGARFMAGPMAGAAGMNFWQFLGWNLLGALVWCFLMVTIGYLLVGQMWSILHMSHRAVQLTELAALVAVMGIYLFLRWRSRVNGR